ncbi:hypothetical protein [Streptomyces sp. NPDC059909]|uniref:hypothetical protein n=1 Tax=Streptomyces sp. NPDC059909 TaxID=3346998 RepID=UPI00365DBE8F
MDQLGDKPESIRRRLEEEKRHARKEEREPSDRGAESREALASEDELDPDEALGDLGDVYRDELYRGGPSSA